MATLLIIDDEANFCYSLERSLRSAVSQVLTAGTARQGIELLRTKRPAAIILDLCLPDLSGLDALDCIRQIDPLLPVLVITAHGTTETAIEAMKRGAFDYLLKPVDFHRLRELVVQAIELSRKRHQPVGFGPEMTDDTAQKIVGSSHAMQEVYKAVGRVASQNIPVLITGESGTGKELLACAIYHHSARRNNSFLTINCAAIPETLLESELFGHEKGAFTGAESQRIGKFEQAHGGTLFLDEVGDMSSGTQAKVLRLLQEQRFERVGGHVTIQTDVRLIAATNKNLEEMTKTGAFRRDLFYRLNAYPLHLPPLRERLEDLPQLVEHFVRLFGPQMGKQVRSFSPEFLQALRSHRWPGNIRELQNILKYALIHSAGDTLTPDLLPRSFLASSSASDGSTNLGQNLAAEVACHVRELLHRGEIDLYRKVIQTVDQALLEEVSRHVNGNQVQASELLGISRTTLRAKLRSLGMQGERE